MEEIKNVKNNNTAKILNPLIAGLTGAAIGAGMTVVTTKVLSDKKTRDKIAHTAIDLRKKIANSVRHMGKDMSRVVEQRIRKPKRRK